MSPARTYVVTGSASGIGQAAARRLSEEGWRVIGVDVAEGDVVADLATDDGRSAVLEAVDSISSGVIHGVVACAGVDAPDAHTIRVNYFGTVRTLELLRPLLARGADPRAVIVSSLACVLPYDATVVGACLADNEPIATAAAATLYRQGERRLVYASTKRALAKWVRRNAPTAAWAGAGITLNAIAPAVVRTPRIEARLAIPEQRELLDNRAPMPMGGPAEPEEVASVLAWLAGPENTLITGQVIFADGGGEVLRRSEEAW